MKKTHLSLLTTGLIFTAIAANASTKFCIEAETATDIQPTLRKTLPGTNAAWSGKGFIEIPWDKNESKGKGQATLKLVVPDAGSYYVWARTFWGNGCGNSILLDVNGSERILGEDGTYGKWHWVDSRTKVELKAGVNTLTLKNRETGIKVDQIFFTTDGEYTPTGIRKITNDGATGKSTK